ncbi:MAG: hypothetical protein HFI46_05280 [Lachnospiraceae bacterium]|jgi:hypothetical protein|nr:hypothetical protein [Lachnospiraceae bacterium]
MCEEGRTVLCGANAYEKKYYFNQAFDRIPDSIKDELHVICVLFTEEVGGIFTVEFEKDGGIFLRTECAQDDFLYDEISSGLLVGEIRRKRQDMFEALSLYYRMFVLHEEAGGLFGEEDT